MIGFLHQTCRRASVRPVCTLTTARCGQPGNSEPVHTDQFRNTARVTSRRNGPQSRWTQQRQALRSRCAPAHVGNLRQRGFVRLISTTLAPCCLLAIFGSSAAGIDSPEVPIMSISSFFRSEFGAAPRCLRQGFAEPHHQAADCRRNAQFGGSTRSGGDQPLRRDCRWRHQGRPQAKQRKATVRRADGSHRMGDPRARAGRRRFSV